MPIAAMLACAVHQSLDLALGEIASLDCQVYDGWCAFLGSRFHADKPSLRGNDCLAYMLSCTVSRWRMESIVIVRAEVRGLNRASRRRGQRPPVGRAREIRRLIQAPSPEIWSETISGSEEGPGGEVG